MKPLVFTKPRSSLTRVFSRPMFAVLGARPTATRQVSASTVCGFASPTVYSTVMPFAVFVTFATLACVWMAMPWCLSDFSSSAEISSSSSGTARGSISSTVTLVPKRWKMEANSTPTAPAPIITIDFGIAGRLRISLLVRRVLASGSRPGNMRASEPVASTIFFAVISCAAPLGIGHADFAGAGNLAEAADHFDLVLFEQEFHALRQLGNNLGFARQDRLPVERKLFADNAEFFGVLEVIVRRPRSTAGPWWGCSRRASTFRQTCRPSQ